MPATSLPENTDTFPQLDAIRAARPTFWANPNRGPATEALARSPVPLAAIREAEDRLARFRPYIAAAFPETAAAGGRIESPLRPVPGMAKALRLPHPDRLLLKMDSHLPISGSIKARGGIYEVLKHAESLAAAAGLLHESDNYAVLTGPEYREFFSRYAVAVGSTGNLGLSIGIISAKLGFKVTVHMSADARQWKKDLLRAKGVTVVEYDADYSRAVREGRAQAAKAGNCHFVDDESSVDLFLGYATAAAAIKRQMAELGIPVSEEQPLSVYLPCGVGGGPGGVAFGLKAVWGDAVRCWFAEPVQAPAVLLGLGTGKGAAVAAEDLGLHGKTAADGLAVGRPSQLVCQAMKELLDGAFTLNDEDLFLFLALLDRTENIRLEPSALAGFAGLEFVAQYERAANLRPSATHIIWGTGGSMVPESEWLQYREVAAKLQKEP